MNKYQKEVIKESKILLEIGHSKTRRRAIRDAKDVIYWSRHPAITEAVEKIYGNK